MKFEIMINNINNINVVASLCASMLYEANDDK